MDKLKKWVAQLFNIRPEDLPESHDTLPSARQIDEKIQEEVKRQLQEQLRLALQGVVLPEIQKIFSEHISQPIPPAAKIDTVPDTDAGPDHAEQHLPAEPASQVNDVLHSQSIPVEEEFPVIEEPELRPTPSAESSQYSSPVDMIERIEDITTPPDTKQDPSIQNGLIPSIEEEITPLEEAVPTVIVEIPSAALHPVKEKDIRIGIDFGTTTTAISIKVGDDRPEALPIGSDETTRYMPSIVYFKPSSGELVERAIVGEEAESFVDQAHIIRSVKRCFGCQGGNCHANNTSGLTSSYPFPWCRGDGKIYINDTEAIQPSQIAYLILREALLRAVKAVRDRMQIDLTAENVCFLPLNLGCSALFNLNRREMICSIAKELGFKKVTIDNVVEEPILAGFTFSRFAEQPEGRALIYDFGGGTFDVAILDIDRFQQNLRVTVIATAGENWLGGDDIDSLVYDHFLNEAAIELDFTPDEVDDRLGSVDRSRLRVLARGAKEQLSTADNYSNVLFAQNLGPLNLDLSRAKFEELLEASGLVSKSLEAVERACKLAFAFENALEGQIIDASVITRHRIYDAAPEINRVILVGGVTKTPYIRNKMKEIFGENKIIQETVIEPISAVAIGGAYPRDPLHYSICVPPFGFYLEYKDSNRSGKRYQIVFEPYEYYDFHKYWISGPLAVYFKDLDLPVDFLNVKICAKKAGDSKPLWGVSLGKLSSGIWRFSISLEGDLYYSKVGENPRLIQGYPITHPIQQAIKDERKRRQELEQEKIKQSQGSHEDQIRSMMNEN